MNRIFQMVALATAFFATSVANSYQYGGGGSQRAEVAELATVVAVVPQYHREEERGRYSRYGGTALGAGVGAAAARGESREVQALAALVGGVVGNKVSNRPRRQRGFDTVIEYEDGRRVAIFTRHDPAVMPGDEVFLIGRNRIVRFR